jgi:hypothetical protein
MGILLLGLAMKTRAALIPAAQHTTPEIANRN